MTADDRARKMLADFLQRVAERTQTSIATSLGVSNSTVCRAVANAEILFQIISRCGLKTEDEDAVVVAADELAFLRRTYAKIVLAVAHAQDKAGREAKEQAS